MPPEIKVGPPVLTIHHGSVFMLTDMQGEISTDSELGVFAYDTRFLSHYMVYADGYRWIHLSSGTYSPYGARFYLTNPEIDTEFGTIPHGTVALTISREAGGSGIREELNLVNYGDSRIQFNLELALRCDFADISEVRAKKLVRRGKVETRWYSKSQELHTRYEHKDFRRGFVYRMLDLSSPSHYANGRINFEVWLDPAESWNATSRMLLVFGDRIPDLDDYTRSEEEVKQDNRQREWMRQSTKLSCSDEDLRHWYSQSVEDIGSMRMHCYDCAPDVWVPAAGIPWYVALFGRDCLVSSLQNMIVNPRLALGPLDTLARMQARERNDRHDAQPGKILHEVRAGELAHFGEPTHAAYYGSADATPLYLIALHETWKWLGDESHLQRYRDTALRCLEWIDDYGDLDGDGFQEYKTFSPRGYENMGWKDSHDAVVYANGSQVEQPKALCELQGYVFDAWLRMAECFDALGERQTSSDLRAKAADLKERFEKAFWSEQLQCYVLGLDAEKKQIDAVSSNPGHCLWSGIADRERAARVVDCFLCPDMWSGWGIRTLSARNPAFNPFSYHRGSIWPHDNGIIALGFKRYGFSKEAGLIARALCESASHFLSYRLPELFSGIHRQPLSFPVQYLGANVPQSWASGSVFHVIQAILGLRGEAPAARLYVDPMLPEWIDELSLGEIAIGKSKVHLRAWRENGATKWDAAVAGEEIDIEQKPWEPWNVEQFSRAH